MVVSMQPYKKNMSFVTKLMIRTEKHNDILFSRLLICLLGLNLVQTVYALLTSNYVSFDDLEHLRAAFFVAGGDVPFRDFFEHHHPLLWYVLAPLLNILPHQTALSFYIGRSISLLVSSIGGYYVYKIEKRFFGSTACALICLNLYFWGITGISNTGLFAVKPDVYQRCCFLIGLYHLLCYFQMQKFKDLQICAIFFALSFLFLQTAVFAIAPLIVPVGYFIYKHPQKYRDFLQASVLPILMLSGSVLFLIELGIFSQYWQLCWQFNSILATVLHAYPHTEYLVMMTDLLMLALGSLAYHISCRQFNIFFSCLGIMFLAELSMRIFFSSTHLQYLVSLVLYAAMLVAPFIEVIIRKYKSAMLILIILSVAHLLINIKLSQAPILAETHDKYDQETSGIALPSGIFKPRQSYFWMYPSIEGLAHITLLHSYDYEATNLYKKMQPDLIILSPNAMENIYKIKRAIHLDDQQQKTYIKHYPNMKMFKNYIEVEKGVYQRQNVPEN